MNIGLIGLGYWGKNLLRNLIIHKDIQNIHIYDTRIEKVKNHQIYFTILIKKNFFQIIILIYLLFHLRLKHTLTLLKSV